MNEHIPHWQKLQMIKNGQLPKECVPKAKKPIPKKSVKKIQSEKEAKEAGGDSALSKWFLEIWVKHSLNGKTGTHCQECGIWIPPDYIHHSTAHLLPKKIFKSVCMHPLNYLILGASCGCHEKTHRIDKFIQMKIWPEAARRIKEMIPLLPIDELRRISNQMLIALDNTPTP